MNNFDSPTRAQSADAYDQLQHRFKETSLESEFVGQIVKYATWSRLDARLGEILVRELARFFDCINPLDLWFENRKCAAPAALAVILEFSGALIEESEDRARLEAFASWRKAVVHGVEPVPFQLFFVKDGAPNPLRLSNELLKSLRVYRKWGFAASESLISSKIGYSESLSRSQRQQILNELIGSRVQLKVDDYMKACDGRVSRRTAERDVSEDKRLRSKGFTRGRYYEVIQAS